MRVERAVAPRGYQCPACGTPVERVELRVAQTPDDRGYGLLLEDCRHLVTFEMLRDAWGIDLPEAWRP